jgi:hypothetical protein
MEDLRGSASLRYRALFLTTKKIDMMIIWKAEYIDESKTLLSILEKQYKSITQIDGSAIHSGMSIFPHPSGPYSLNISIHTNTPLGEVYGFIMKNLDVNKIQPYSSLEARGKKLYFDPEGYKLDKPIRRRR